MTGLRRERIGAGPVVFGQCGACRDTLYLKPVASGTAFIFLEILQVNYKNQIEEMLKHFTQIAAKRKIVLTPQITFFNIFLLQFNSL